MFGSDSRSPGPERKWTGDLSGPPIQNQASLWKPESQKPYITKKKTVDL